MGTRLVRTTRLPTVCNEARTGNKTNEVR
jgi:hypothetical protein